MVALTLCFLTTSLAQLSVCHLELTAVLPFPPTVATFHRVDIMRGLWINPRRRPHRGSDGAFPRL